MTRDKLLNNICPGCMTIGCCNGDKSFNCSDCNRVLNEMLDKYDKQIREDAIDDFVHECDKYCGFYSGKNKSITREDVLKIAEQLKAKKQ